MFKIIAIVIHNILMNFNDYDDFIVCVLEAK